MSEAHLRSTIANADRPQAPRQPLLLRRAIDWLSLAATPTFAAMALLTGFAGDGPLDQLCSAGHGGSALGGMAAMYALMSAFHTPPWLRLISARRDGVRAAAE
jgi:hypothetical protein